MGCVGPCCDRGVRGQRMTGLDAHAEPGWPGRTPMDSPWAAASPPCIVAQRLRCPATCIATCLRLPVTAVLVPHPALPLLAPPQRGLMGDAAAGGVAMCQEPNFWPVLYDPAAPEGTRYTELGRSQIARLLHSTAGLTLAGSVMVSGGKGSLLRCWCVQGWVCRNTTTGTYGTPIPARTVVVLTPLLVGGCMSTNGTSPSAGGSLCCAPAIASAVPRT